MHTIASGWLGGDRKTTRNRRTLLQVEILEARETPSVATVQAGQVVRTATSAVLGADLPGYDRYLSAAHDGTGITPDAQTVQMVQNAGLSLLRLSDGSGADEFHFSQPSPPNQFPAGAALRANFIAAVGADAIVTVNFGTGTPQEAAAYLAYLDGSTANNFAIGTDTHGTDWKTVAYWATLRSQNALHNGDGLDFLRAGHPAPYGFHFWEVGNEVYFGAWDGNVAPSATAYVSFARTFAGLAQNIAPNIAIGVDVGNPVEWDPGWNIPMLQACAAQHFTPGFLSDHLYVYDGQLETLSDQTLLQDTVSQPGSVMPSYHAHAPRNWADRAADFRALLDTYLPSTASQVQLIAGEFNSNADGNNKQSSSLVNGLFLADAIGAILQTEYDGLSFWDLRNGYTNLADNPNLHGWRTGSDEGMLGSDFGGSPPATGPYVPYPTYFAAELASKMVHTGDQVVAASSDRLDLAIYAVKQANGHLALLVINKSAGSDIQETVNLNGFTPAMQATLWQYGMAQDDAQRDSTDGSSSLFQANPSLSISTTANGSSFAMLFPAYSMTVLDLAPSGQSTTQTGSFIGSGVQQASLAFDGSGRQVTAVVYDDGSLYLFDSAGAHFIGGFVQSASVAYDPQGQQVLDVVFASHELWSYDSSGAHFIGKSVQSVSVAFDSQGQQVTAAVFTVGAGLYLFDSAGVHFVAPNVQTVSLAFDRLGREVLDLVYTNTTLYQFDTAGAHFIGNGVQSVGLGFNPLGQAILDVVFLSSEMWQY